MSELLSPDFLFRNAILGGLGVALLCSLLGIYLVLRRLVLIGVALPQASAAGIDPEAEQGILDLLRELRETRGFSIWMVTHHVHSIRGRADRTVVVSEGRVHLDEAA